MREARATKEQGLCGRADTAQLVTDVTAFSQISEPTLSLLYAYWDGKRGDRRFPSRGDLDPVDIPALLPSIFLVAVRRDPFDLVFRLAGGVLTGCYGCGMAGGRLSDLPGSATQELYEQAVRAVRSGRPVLLSGALRTPVDCFQRADHLLLPLGDSPDRVDMLIGGALFRAYPVGERPERQRGAPAPRRKPFAAPPFGAEHGRVGEPMAAVKSKPSGGR